MATCPVCGNTHTCDTYGVVVCKNCEEKLNQNV